MQRTHAFYKLEDNVPDEVKCRRVGEVLNVFRSPALEANRRMIGSIQLMLIERASQRSENDWKGRNDQNIRLVVPDKLLPVGHLRAQEFRKPKAGDYVAAEVTDCTSLTLIGKPLYITSLTDFFSSYGHC